MKSNIEEIEILNRLTTSQKQVEILIPEVIRTSFYWLQITTNQINGISIVFSPMKTTIKVFLCITIRNSLLYLPREDNIKQSNV